MVRTDVAVSAMMLALLGALTTTSACSSSDSAGDPGGTNPTGPGSSGGNGPPGSSGGGPGATADPHDGIRNGNETDVDCGGTSGKKCAEGKSCLTDSDCDVACSYAKKCVGAPSCATHLGGDTCGVGEVGEASAKHESCCRSLPVPGFTDGAHPGKAVYLDKYEITAGRVREWMARMAKEYGGNANVRDWIAKHRPALWDPAWDLFLPTDAEGGSTTIGRRLLGDPRPEDKGSTDPPGPGVILPPATDQLRHMGTNFQFGSEIYVDLHGNNCATFPDSFGFPTYYYPADILARDNQLPRANGVTATGQPVSAKDLLDVKSMNCITNAMMAAFCAWDGGQLATDEVLDFITESPATLANVSGCGTQYDNHGELGNNVFDHTVQTGGRCAAVSAVNATFDAGDNLPVPNSPLNVHNYHFPDTGNPTHDKAWQVAAPGRASLANGQVTDAISLRPGDEPWVDLHGNLNEAALDVTGATFTGMFSLKYRGIAYGSSRSDLNVTLIKGESILRVQRPEAKAAYIGGRCMRFK